jgi:hypothetical protein
MRILLGLALFFAFISTNSYSSILPKNNLYLEDNVNLISNVSKKEFDEMIKKAEKHYKPIVDAHWGDLDIRSHWWSSTVNATAERDDDKWIVNMYGGLARRPEVSEDGFFLVLCHELGHHLAGFPFVSTWAANEGQSDYFATQVCARNIWKDEIEENEEARDSVHAVAKEKCDQVYSSEAEQNLCYRIANAGESLARLLASLSKKEDPTYDTKDSEVIKRTYNLHPNPQCRLDTYIAGALCSTSFDEAVIPGAYSNRRDGELEALANSCSSFRDEHSLSFRPKCWFAQRVNDVEEDNK